MYCQKSLGGVTHRSAVSPKPKLTPKQCAFADLILAKTVLFSNNSRPISFYGLFCLKLSEVPKNWLCPLCHKTSTKQKNFDDLDVMFLGKHSDLTLFVFAKRKHFALSNS